MKKSNVNMNSTRFQLSRKLLPFISLALTLIFCASISFAQEEDVFHELIQEWEETRGPFWSWSLEDKALFYWENVYENPLAMEGPIRAVPSQDSIDAETAKQISDAAIMERYGITKDELEALVLELNYFTNNNYFDESQDKDIYNIRYLQPSKKHPGVYQNVYQVGLSAFSGEVYWLAENGELSQ